MKKKTKVLIAIAGILTLIQWIRPKLQVSEIAASDLPNLSREVNAILKKSCFDCHSETANLQWYDRITPVNFIVASHIKEGRKALNFSKWDSIATPQQNAILYNSLNKILAGEMPLPSYAVMHSSAKLKVSEIETIKKYLVSRTPRKSSDKIEMIKTDGQHKERELADSIVSWTKVESSPNGIKYIPDYRSWRAISTTDRFDNGSIRIIFANDIAVNAISSRRTNPWPDGSILAKTAWKQVIGKDGNISTGSFIHVEFMIKDAKKYRKTEGWGWARWKGEDLRPYGQIGVEKECISCHKPVKDNDNVFTIPLNTNDLTKAATK